MECTARSSRNYYTFKYSYNKLRIGGFWTVSLPELSPKERQWLLEAYLEFFNVTLETDEFNICPEWLQGYPQQVFCLADSLSQQGFQRTKELSKKIVDYSLRKVDIILNEYINDPKKMEFLATLAELEFTKLDNLVAAFNNEKAYKEFLTELLTRSICTCEGVAKEYVRLSDAVSDYIKRKRIQVNNNALSFIKKESTRLPLHG